MKNGIIYSYTCYGLCHLQWKSRWGKLLENGLKNLNQWEIQIFDGGHYRQAGKFSQSEITSQGIWIEILPDEKTTDGFLHFQLNAIINNKKFNILDDVQWHVPAENITRLQISHVTGFYTWIDDEKVLRVQAYVHFEKFFQILQNQNDLKLLLPHDYQSIPRSRSYWDLEVLLPNKLYVFLDFQKINSDLNFEICLQLKFHKNFHNGFSMDGFKKFGELQINGVSENNKSEIISNLIEGEFLLDFSIYDENGRFLFGRGGVETWINDNDEYAKFSGIQIASNQKFIRANFNINSPEDYLNMKQSGHLEGYKCNAFIFALSQDTELQNLQIGLRILKADLDRIRGYLKLFN